MHKAKYIEKIRTTENIFGDNIAYVEKWDFSKANTNDEARIEGVTKVASICYANDNAFGREALYDRLKAESMGLPSSSFEFIPVLVNADNMDTIFGLYADALDQDDASYAASRTSPDIVTFGEFIDDNGSVYLLTNYRALLADSRRFNDDSIALIFNETSEEQRIIRENSNVFMAKMDMATARQFNRTRIMLQELSRRYVNGKKEPFEIYLSPTVESSEVMINIIDMFDENGIATVDARKYCEAGIELYLALLKDGVPAEEARRVIPIGAYTKIWSSFLPRNMSNFYDLRLDSHAQTEIRLLAQAMKGVE